MVKHHIHYRHFELEVPEGDFLIGRSSECNLVLDDASVSRVHAVITNTGEKICVADRGSRNGIIINGKQIRGTIELRDGDELAIGHQIIHIVSSSNPKDAEKTVGLRACEHCGKWTDANEPFCSGCGKKMGKLSSASPPAVADYQRPADRPRRKPNDKARESVIVEQEAVAAMAGLALKILQMGKVEESERLIEGATKTAFKKLEKQEELTTSDYQTLSQALLEYAGAAKSSSHVSAVFKLHLAGKLLISRNLVEVLYETVKKAGYLTCSDMRDYLEYLESIKKKFSPGESFVHRRLTGLVKICS